MRLLLLVPVAILGCRASDSDYPIGGGGVTGGGGTLSTDAFVASTGDGAPISATACVLTDPRDLTGCRATGSAGLMVVLGTRTAVTLDNGTFTIAPPTTTAVVWDVTGSTVVESVTAFTGQTRIPVMDAVVFTQLLADNGIVQSAGTGSIMLRISRGGVPVPGESVAVTPQPGQYNALYDGSNASVWTTTATGSFGTALVPGVTTGSASATVSASGTSQRTISGIPITDGGVTFVFVQLP